MLRTVGLRYLGHSTVLVELGGRRILTDPVLRPVLGPLVRTVPPPEPSTYGDLDAVVVSHLHLDHLDVGSLRRIPRGPLLVLPRGARSLLRGTHHHDIAEVLPGDSIELDGVTILATHAQHPGNRLPGGLRGTAMGYLLGSRSEAGRPIDRVYFAGDTELFPGMADLGGPDVALLPVGGWGLTRGTGHLDPRDAAHALTLIRPRFAMPIHWGTLWPRGLGAVRPARRTSAGAAFARFAAELAPAVEVVVAQPGHWVELGPTRDAGSPARGGANDGTDRSDRSADDGGDPSGDGADPVGARGDQPRDRDDPALAPR